MLHIRPATPADVPTLLRFIRELAAYEREPDAVLATEADLLRDGFGLTSDGVTKLATEVPPRFTALIADWQTTENQQLTTDNYTPAGFALYFTSYSTWLGHHGIRLEDLYVTPALRGKGIGKALLARLARIAVDEGCPRLEWDVLHWNEPAIAVYRRLGATTQAEWSIMRLTGEALQTLAAQSPKPNQTLSS
jgi:GNAT superfamily N-acetyltransferase